MADDAEEKMRNGRAGLAVLALVPVLVAFPPLVIMKLWAWHVVPVWRAPALSYGHSLGLSALLGILKARLTPSRKTTSVEDLQNMVAMLAAVAIALLVGWWAA